jgi:hypothetical protein
MDGEVGSTRTRDDAATMAEVTAEVTAAVRAELAGLEDARIREVNSRHGDDHGVDLTRLRALAQRL